jgi:2-polyprenyl-3-methyl-5-hydroxy-6-metoxy-1,4-benzoquinol methylase
MTVLDAWHSDGGMSRYAKRTDPKRIAFTAARYLNTAKLLAGQRRVLEIGCADGAYSDIVRQHVGELTGIDIDPVSIVEARMGVSAEWPIWFEVGNILDGPLAGFDAAYSLDVIEHVPDEDRFLANLSATAAVAVIGTPSLQSQIYASEMSRAGHVNCKSGDDLKTTLGRHYRHVFVFSMNDATLHTGFYPMAHYLLALCCEPI